MVTRKTAFNRKKETTEDLGPAPKKFDKKLKFESLADAILDGKFVGKVGDELAVERLHNGKRQKMICEVKAIEGDKIDTWDLTLFRWFNFTPELAVKHDVVVKFHVQKS